MNQSVSEGRNPSTGQTSMLPDFIVNAAKHAHVSCAHVYAQSRCDEIAFQMARFFFFFFWAPLPSVPGTRLHCSSLSTHRHLNFKVHRILSMFGLKGQPVKSFCIFQIYSEQNQKDDTCCVLNSERSSWLQTKFLTYQKQNQTDKPLDSSMNGSRK